MTDKHKLVKFHFYLLAIILVNFALSFWDLRLNQGFLFILKVALYTSGIVLFYRVIRPFKLISIYFSFYTISAICIGFFFLFGGMFLALLTSIFLYPISPNQFVYKTENIKIYSEFNGFLGTCCSYEVVETKLYIFEKKLGNISTIRPINRKNDKVFFQKNKIVHHYENVTYDTVLHKEIKKDTFEVYKLKRILL